MKLVSPSVSFLGLFVRLWPRSLSPSPLPSGARHRHRRASETVITIGTLISIVGVLNGWVLVDARAPLAAARCGEAPAFLARLHPATSRVLAAMSLSPLTRSS